MTATDILQPFRLRPESLPDRQSDIETAGQTGGATMHGRLVRLGPVVEDIISRHDYPVPVGTLLGECLALTAALAGGLKFDGVFTLQIQTKGPVPLVVADATSSGELRGYAEFDAQKLPSPEAIAAAPVPTLLGKGHMVFTVDMGPDKDRYQGMVEISGDNLTACAHHYFRQSEQLDTAIMLAASRRQADNTDPTWSAGALMLQRLPEIEGDPLSSDDGDDPWRRAMMLLSTGTDDELLDAQLGADLYLHRLFHQEGLVLQTPRPWVRACRCSADRMQTALRALPVEDRDDIVVDGSIEVTCQFCNETRIFDPETLDQRAAE